jgi:hypothetical protein
MKTAKLFLVLIGILFLTSLPAIAGDFEACAAQCQNEINNAAAYCGASVMATCSAACDPNQYCECNPAWCSYNGNQAECTYEIMVCMTSCVPSLMPACIESLDSIFPGIFDPNFLPNCIVACVNN